MMFRTLIFADRTLMDSRMIKFFLATILFFLCFASTAIADRPNVIVIMTDDQGYGEFSCNGNPITNTPNIDALAAKAVRLTDFHVAPMCTPTRGQLMTGIDAFRNAASNVSSGRTMLRADLKTMADVYRSGGYASGLFGKWHLGDNYPFRPKDRGFGEAIQWMKSIDRSKPFFSYIALNAAHSPWFVPDHYREKTRESLLANPSITANLSP